MMYYKGHVIIMRYNVINAHVCVVSIHVCVMCHHSCRLVNQHVPNTFLSSNTTTNTIHMNIVLSTFSGIIMRSCVWVGYERHVQIHLTTNFVLLFPKRATWLEEVCATMSFSSFPCFELCQPSSWWLVSSSHLISWFITSCNLSFILWSLSSI